MNISKIALMTAALALGTSGSAQAALMTYGFDCITGNAAANCSAGEAQLFVDVTDQGVAAGQVAFIFRNAGPAASSITDVYFDDGTLLGIASIINGAGVAFSPDASPGDLPGANNISPAFETTAGFSADSDPPTQPMGVNPGETLTVVFNLINGQDYASTLAALALAGAPGGLRIGIHVQGFANGGSESFVNDGDGGGSDSDPQEPMPEPATMALLGLGLALAGSRLRKRAQ